MEDIFTSSEEMYDDNPDYKKKTWLELCNGWMHDEYNIRGFFGEYRFLSNFYLSDIVYEDLCYISSENAYQACKVIREERFNFETITPAESKKDWKNYTPQYSARKWDEEIKYHAMFLVLYNKFTQNDVLKEKLLATGEKYLEETNWWNDTYWGVCNGIGLNNLGKQLMTIRNILK